MKEEAFLDIIKSVIGDKYIGDDCAYLKDMGIVISQDSLVEDVHFSLKYTTPYRLGYKSAMVNISDIAASGGRGKYITVALSLPKNIDENFIKEFYSGLNDAVKKYDIEIVGGDLTGSDKIMVSVTVLGTTEGRRISSRSNAKAGQVVVTSGVHGSSAYGLELLKSNKPVSDSERIKYITPHLCPEAQVEFGRTIAENIGEDYAMMDSSDGLADVLYKIATASDKTIVVDFEKVKYEKGLDSNLVLFGGEDYQIVATVPFDFAKKYNLDIIGYVAEKIENVPVKIENINGSELVINNLDNSFNHF